MKMALLLLWWLVEIIKSFEANYENIAPRTADGVSRWCSQDIDWPGLPERHPLQQWQNQAGWPAARHQPAPSFVITHLLFIQASRDLSRRHGSGDDVDDDAFHFSFGVEVADVEGVRGVGGNYGMKGLGSFGIFNTHLILYYISR